MARDPALARSPLFEGLDDAELDVVAEHMRARQFAPGEQLCRGGRWPDRIWLITGGLVIWTAAATAGGGEIVLRMRKGDVIGAQDAITGTERTATVVASMHTSTLELDAKRSPGPGAPFSADPDQRHPDPARAALSRERA